MLNNKYKTINGLSAAQNKTHLLWAVLWHKIVVEAAVAVWRSCLQLCCIWTSVVISDRFHKVSSFS